jgi:ketosteroid isomerase-like protein
VAIKCPTCHSDNPDALKFCGKCGTRPEESAVGSQLQKRRIFIKRIAIAVCVVVLVLAVAIIAQTTQTTFKPRGGSAEEELIKFEKEWSEAYVKRDVAALDRLEADGIVLADSDGNVFTKSQDIEEVKAGVLVVTSFVQDDIKIHVYGDAAVVTYRSTEKGRYRGEDYSPQFRYTDTWIKKAGRWQVVAAHWSKITGN